MSHQNKSNVEEYLDGYRKGFYDAYKKFAAANCQSDCKTSVKRLLRSQMTTIRQHSDDDENRDFSDRS